MWRKVCPWENGGNVCACIVRDSRAFIRVSSDRKRVSLKLYMHIHSLDSLKLSVALPRQSEWSAFSDDSPFPARWIHMGHELYMHTNSLNSLQLSVTLRKPESSAYTDDSTSYSHGPSQFQSSLVLLRDEVGVSTPEKGRSRYRVILRDYGVASISRLLKMMDLLCKRALWNRLYSAKETYDLKEPTNRSHPILV